RDSWYSERTLGADGIETNGRSAASTPDSAPGGDFTRRPTEGGGRRRPKIMGTDGFRFARSATPTVDARCLAAKSHDGVRGGQGRAASVVGSPRPRRCEACGSPTCDLVRCRLGAGAHGCAGLCRWNPAPGAWNPRGDLCHGPRRIRCPEARVQAGTAFWCALAAWFTVVVGGWHRGARSVCHGGA